MQILNMTKRVSFLVIFIWMKTIFSSMDGSIFANSQRSLPVTRRNYDVYWNVPTQMCQQYGMYFEEVDRDYGIIRNRGDQFHGEKIVILYDPGKFPAILKHPNGSPYLRNHGIPQEGDLSEHLNLFRVHVEEQMDKNFSGLGVIDFEHWRPIFRQNWGSLNPYRNTSFSIEKPRHPSWETWKINKETIKRFEEFGKIFMEETLNLAKSLRPEASWGYYAYPYCFNLSPGHNISSCSEQLERDNNNMSWLWTLEDVLLPSVYLSLSHSRNDEVVELITGRLRESVRIIKKYSLSSKIFPYFTYKYIEQPNITLSKRDTRNSFRAMLDNGASGHIIWGSSNDFNSKQKCRVFRDYLNDTLGPAILEIKELAGKSTYPNGTIVENVAKAIVMSEN